MGKVLYVLSTGTRWEATVIKIDGLDSVKNENLYIIHGSTIKLWLSTFPNHKVVCRDLLSLDKLIECRIQPSQVVLMSELCSLKPRRKIK